MDVINTLFVAVVGLCSLLVFTLVLVIGKIGWEPVSKFVQGNGDALKMALAIVAGVFTAVVFLVELRDARVANALAFQERAASAALKHDFETLKLFWIRRDGRKPLEKYRELQREGADEQTLTAANDKLAEQTRRLIRQKRYEDEIMRVYDFYKDVVVCVRQGRCHQTTACELFAKDVELFRINYSEFLFEWDTLWGGGIEDELADFYANCGLGARTWDDGSRWDLVMAELRDMRDRGLRGRFRRASCDRHAAVRCGERNEGIG